ncbi:hypothetical protein G6F22_022004 [Rhizopus arrhizus]|nr:hypothetical protein G6F22_022004 [Rhizopus arrhizus]
MGRKRSSAASWMAARGVSPRLRSASSAKSIIMMPFFFTMPISRMIPMMPIMSSSVPLINNASKAPTPADGKVDRIVMGWM